MDSKNITLDILRKYDTRAKKRFGQNFLIDDYILEEIVNNSDITKEDIVIEIGPGLGNLTHYILEKASKVIAFEIDEMMIEILRDRFKDVDNLQVINEDILKVKLKDYVSKDQKIKVIANLPYYITTPILFNLFEQSNNISEIVVMVQKEVAQRIVAQPKSKEYGVLTIGANYHSIPNIIIDVPKESFIPSPNVNSAVLKMMVKRRYEVSNEKLFFEFVKKSFSQRRKKVINSLESTGFNNMSKDEINKLLENNDIGSNARAEEISIEKYVTIINSIAQK